MSDLNQIASELDEFHAAARSAYRDRDLASYRKFFSEDLQYLQLNGKAINHSQMMRDAEKQLRQHKAVDSEMIRESIEIMEDGNVVQELHHVGRYSVTVALFFTKSWTIFRQGKYKYRKTDAGWEIFSVEIVAEQVKSGWHT